MFNNIVKRFVKNLSKDVPEVKSESVKFSEVNKWIKNKEKEIKDDEEGISEFIKEKLSLFTIEVNEKLGLLDDINLDKAKENLRTKHIVLTNLKEYVRLVENLLNELENFKSLDLINLTNLINSSFSNFNNRSHIKYKKATYLIGQKLGDVNESIQKFLRTYSKIIKENKEIIKTPKTIQVIKEKLEGFEENKKENKKINSNIKQNKLDIKNFEQKISQFSIEIKDIESSKEYVENLKNVKRKKELQLELKKEINVLKQSIDFKALTRIFHVSEKYRVIVKSFKEDFNESFKQDNGRILLKLLDESKLNNENIATKINKITNKSKEIKDMKSKSEDDKIQIVKDKIKKLDFEINNSNEEIEKEQKRNQKINEFQKQIKDSIEQELLKLNVDMEK